MSQIFLDIFENLNESKFGEHLLDISRLEFSKIPEVLYLIRLRLNGPQNNLHRISSSNEQLVVTINNSYLLSVTGKSYNEYISLLTQVITI